MPLHALTELNHFSNPANGFRAQYVEREPALQSAMPPFSRSFVLPSLDCKGTLADTMSPFAEFLYQDLLTPVGRAADTCRGERRARPGADAGLVVRSFGSFRLSWPRRRVLEAAARRYCKHVVQSWISKDAKPIQEKVCASLREQTMAQQLEAERLITRFQAACEKKLERTPEALFATVTDPVAHAVGSGQGAGQLAETLRKIESIVGHPSETTVLREPGLLEETLAKEGDDFTGEAQQKLNELIGDLIEEPGLRLAGAEEALRQLIASVEQTLKHQEPLVEDLSEKASKSRERLQFLVSSIDEIAKGGRRSAQLGTELKELLRLHPKWRYQSLVLRRVTISLTSLRGFLSDQLREISFYRLRLRDLLRLFEQVGTDESADSDWNVRSIFPGTCRTLEESVDQALPTLTLDRLQVLDARIQNLIRQQFTGLAHVCTASSNLVEKLEAAMVAEMRAAVEEHFAGHCVVDLYLSQHPQDEEAIDDLTMTYADASAPLPERGRSTEEVAIVTVSQASDNHRLVKLLQQAARPRRLSILPSPMRLPSTERRRSPMLPSWA